MQLRPYQRGAVDAVFDYFGRESGNPIVVLPTGSGKSLTMAAIIKEACAAYPATRVLLLSHVKELLEQDAKAIIRHWPSAPVALYSAGLGTKKVDQITIAGIQSAYKLPALFSPIDLCFIDECHLVPKKSEGVYRTFLDGLLHYNPLMKIVGMTATHYRLDSGILTEGEGALFTDVAYEADIATLIRDGYLCELTTRAGAARADLSGVGTRSGEFIPGQLAKVMDDDSLTTRALNEVFERGADRHSWLVFCAGVDHALHVAAAIRARGISCETVTGDTPKVERARILSMFKSGHVQAVTNCDVLTTGFDAPNIDMIVMLRPTKSTGLYVQMVGRGLRIHPAKTDTLVLDFAGNIERHGPIDQIRVKPKRQRGPGEDGLFLAPVKECPGCRRFVAPAALMCMDCGHQFPPPERGPETDESSAAAIIASMAKPETVGVAGVSYRAHEKIDKPTSMRVDYMTNGLRTYSEWVCIEHEGYARKQAVRWFWERGIVAPDTVAEALQWAQAGQIKQPVTITVKQDGKFQRVVGASFNHNERAAA